MCFTLERVPTVKSVMCFTLESVSYVSFLQFAHNYGVAIVLCYAAYHYA